MQHKRSIWDLIQIMLGLALLAYGVWILSTLR